VVEAVEYMAHRSEEVDEGVLNRSTSRGGSYRPGSTSEEHRVLHIAFFEEQVIYRILLLVINLYDQ